MYQLHNSKKFWDLPWQCQPQLHQFTLIVETFIFRTKAQLNVSQPSNLCLISCKHQVQRFDKLERQLAIQDFNDKGLQKLQFHTEKCKLFCAKTQDPILKYYKVQTVQNSKNTGYQKSVMFSRWS